MVFAGMQIAHVHVHVDGVAPRVRAHREETRAPDHVFLVDLPRCHSAAALRRRLEDHVADIGGEESVVDNQVDVEGGDVGGDVDGRREQVLLAAGDASPLHSPRWPVPRHVKQEEKGRKGGVRRGRAGHRVVHLSSHFSPTLTTNRVKFARSEIPTSVATASGIPTCVTATGTAKWLTSATGMEAMRTKGSLGTG